MKFTIINTDTIVDYRMLHSIPPLQRPKLQAVTMNFAMGRNSSSTYDFEFPSEIKDALSIAPSKAGGSGGGGGSGSVHTGVSRLRTSQSTQFNPHPQISFGGSDDVSVAFSTSRPMTANQADQSNGKCPSIQEILSCRFLILITLL